MKRVRVGVNLYPYILQLHSILGSFSSGIWLIVVQFQSQYTVTIRTDGTAGEACCAS
jgi:hypothetical protein